MRRGLKLGISIVLDGVFNHVGADSRYFNRYGTYGQPGAWQAHEQGSDSPYADWFGWHEDGTYECWWGVDDLPAVNEENPGYRKLITGEDGVVRHWLAAGARGWRLDVADELPDEFIEQIARPPRPSVRTRSCSARSGRMPPTR